MNNVNNTNFKVSVVIPCFNEEENIFLIYSNLLKVLDNYKDYEVIYVDDGSEDKTLEKIQKLGNDNKNIKYLSLSRNFGHQNAIKAGLDYSSGDCVISLDADLQHPPEIIDKMIKKWLEGYDVVYTIRINAKLSFYKRITSKLFYKIINILSSTKIQQNAADFRLLDKKVVEQIREIKENYLFIRGLISWIGFKQTFIKYKPNERFAGNTKYSFRKMSKFALSGITSFSTKPLYFSIIIGVIIAFLAFLYGVYVIYAVIFTDKVIIGWASLIASVLFIGGLQLIMIGIIGEYLGKLFMENKRRPNYIIKEKKI